MGTYRTTYIGPFLKVTGKIEISTDIQTCPNVECRMHKRDLGSDFCPFCGSRRSEMRETELVIPHSYQLADRFDFDVDLLLSPPYPEGVMIPNSRIAGVTEIDIDPSCDGDFASLAEIDIPAELMTFRSDPEYGPVVARLEEAGLVAVKYGVVVYYL